jgi:hypothetical protein
MRDTKEFLWNKQRREMSLGFGFQEDSMLVSCCSKWNKVVRVFSVIHHDDTLMKRLMATKDDHLL